MPLLCCFSCQQNSIDQTLLDSILVSQRNANHTVEEQTQRVYHRTVYTLEDESKIRYRSIIPAMDAIHSTTKEMKSELGAFESQLKEGSFQKKRTQTFAKIIDRIDQTRLSLLTIHHNLLEVHGDTFGLSPLLIESRQQAIHDSLSILLSNARLKHNITNFSSHELMICLAKMTLDISCAEALLTTYLAELTGGKALICFFYYSPTFYVNQLSNSEGSPSEALIMLEPPLQSEKLSNIHLMANGQRLSVYNGLFALYQQDSTVSTIELSGKTTNPLTGSTSYLFPITPYTVQLK